MSEPITERLYYLTEFMDEVLSHNPSLEGAAYFLLHGRRDASDTELSWGEPPLAKDGDIVDLDVVELWSDRKAVGTWDEEHEWDGWLLEPPPPEGADFFAIRFAPGAGWEFPHDTFSSLQDELNDGGESEYHHIVVGRTSSVKATFRTIDGKPTLTVIEPAEDRAATIRQGVG